ncbi:hypothetical protein SVIOM342S_06096 [Streptomyces violaceorubidus]
MTAVSCGRLTGSVSCQERAVDSGWRSRKTKRASGQQSLRRWYMYTLAGVFSTTNSLPDL